MIRSKRLNWHWCLLLKVDLLGALTQRLFLFYRLQCRTHDLDPQKEHHNNDDAVHHHLECKGCNFGFHDICSCFCAGVLISLVCPHRRISGDVAETSATVVVLCILQVLPGLRIIIRFHLILISWAVVDEQGFFGIFQTFVVEGPRCEGGFVKLLEFAGAATI